MNVHSSRHPDRATMLLSHLRFPVGNIGYGIRAGIWLPGCRVFCRACLAGNTWVFDESTRCGVEAILDWLRELPAEQLDGVTISGSEPTGHPVALRALLDGINCWRADSTRPTDILLYSGRSTAALAEQLPWLATSVDALVTEHPLASEASCPTLRGVANREVVVGSPLGTRRYATVEFESDLMSSDSYARPGLIAGTTAPTVAMGRSR
ncbi:4Fe-4S cluster-binding domain-containing protein [Nocardia sp. NPDC051756]|uniref:4Fe-4S cluster-binding domain-containing protein n=1 Tax=Nocardia sp. NPDC051756 TaxID=3154751 RepID=UPI00341A059B